MAKSKSCRKKIRKRTRRDSLKWAARFHGQYIWREGVYNVPAPGTHTETGTHTEWINAIFFVVASVHKGYGVLLLANVIARQSEWARIHYVEASKVHLAKTPDLVMARMKEELWALPSEFSEVPAELKKALKYWEGRRNA